MSTPIREAGNAVKAQLLINPARGEQQLVDLIVATAERVAEIERVLAEVTSNHAQHLAALEAALGWTTLDNSGEQSAGQ